GLGKLYSPTSASIKPPSPQLCFTLPRELMAGVPLTGVALLVADLDPVSTFKMAKPSGLFTIGLIWPGASPTRASRNSGRSDESTTVPRDPPSAEVESMDSFRATSSKFSPCFNRERTCCACSRELTTMIRRNAVAELFWLSGCETCEKRERQQSPAH